MDEVNKEMENIGLINRVAESGIITLNLEDFFPKHDFAVFDIKDYLFPVSYTHLALKQQIPMIENRK